MVRLAIDPGTRNAKGFPMSSISTVRGTMSNPVTLGHASAEWRSRPAHERYYDVADLIAPMQEEFRNLRIVKAAQSCIDVSADETGEIRLALPNVDAPITLSNWAFDRLCKQIDVSPKDMRRYPAELVAPIIKHQLMHSSGISSRDDEVDDYSADDMDGDIAALFGDAGASMAAADQSRELQFMVGPRDGGLQSRSVYSGSYGTYSPLKLVRDAMLACERGWRTPRAWATGTDPFPAGHPQAQRIATVDDCMRCSIIKEGDKIGPAGVYRGDRNIFIFLANDCEVLPNLYKFITIEDGEDRTLRATFGLMNYSCGNHNLWGCVNVQTVSKKHRKGAVALFRDEFLESLERADKGMTVPLGLYHAAKNKILGASADAVSDEVFDWSKKKALQSALTRRVIDASIGEAERHPEDLDGASPYSVWGVVQGLTRYSQLVTRGGRHFADQRQSIDRAAGSLLDTVKVEDGPVSASIGATVIDGGVILDTTNDNMDAPALPAPAKRGRKAKVDA